MVANLLRFGAEGSVSTVVKCTQVFLVEFDNLYIGLGLEAATWHMSLDLLLQPYEASICLMHFCVEMR